MSKLEQIGPNASSWPMGLRIFQSDKTATFVVQHWPSHGQGWHDMKAHLSPWFLCVVVAATGCRPEPLEVFGMEDMETCAGATVPSSSLLDRSMVPSPYTPGSPPTPIPQDPHPLYPNIGINN